MGVEKAGAGERSSEQFDDQSVRGMEVWRFRAKKGSGLFLLGIDPVHGGLQRAQCACHKPAGSPEPFTGEPAHADTHSIVHADTYCYIHFHIHPAHAAPHA